MVHFSVVFALAGLALGVAVSDAGAQTGRPVQTETVIAQSDTDRAMPEIPADANETVETAEEALPSPPPDIELPTVLYDVQDLPPAVRRTRDRIIAAAASGDLDQLKPIIADNGQPPAFSFGHVEEPIAYLRSLSGDAAGREILAILIEVLEAGFVHADEGTAEEMYVWPYFARYPVDALTPEQIVELFKLVYAGDYEDMLAYGYYLSYRAGIAPDGTWRYFIAGD